MESCNAELKYTKKKKKIKTHANHFFLNAEHKYWFQSHEIERKIE